MVFAFYIALIGLVLAESLKGLSANGTPPILQKFSWQLDLAYFMWSSIATVRLVLAAALVLIILTASTSARLSLLSGGALLGAVLLGAVWGFVYWLFNSFWVGKRKFLPLINPVFAVAADNRVDPDVQVIGVNFNGIQKAYPAPVLFYHHQISDDIGGQAIAATYCGMCRSGRVYDRVVDGKTLEFSLVGAVSFNAILKDHLTGTWWRQETGAAVKGPLAGKQLDDIAFEQMSLKNWLAKYPQSQILQYDPAFRPKYEFFHKLLSYEASLPGWHRQETPPMIIGVEIAGEARAYDLNELVKKRLVTDELGGRHLLVLSSADGTSEFVFDRTVNGNALDFEIDGDVLTDASTNSTWNLYGQCVSGQLQGSQLAVIQSYKQFLRAWITFHPETDFYAFQFQPGAIST